MIERFEKLPMSELTPMIDESVSQGFRFLTRLSTEWSSGENRFEKENEGFYGFWIEENLMAVGGLNIDPFSEDPRIGRLRRFYVKESQRRKGIGRRLVSHILEKAQSNFDCITLNTDTSLAARFYESLGFVRTSVSPSTSHKIESINNARE